MCIKRFHELENRVGLRGISWQRAVKVQASDQPMSVWLGFFIIHHKSLYVFKDLIVGQKTALEVDQSVLIFFI